MNAVELKAREERMGDRVMETAEEGELGKCKGSSLTKGATRAHTSKKQKNLRCLLFSLNITRME